MVAFHIYRAVQIVVKKISVLPRHTKVVVTRNNRTKFVLVGLRGVVKKAVGLGEWPAVLGIVTGKGDGRLCW
ncbi:unnamed protein product, partial [Ilex paraguariensis]